MRWTADPTPGASLEEDADAGLLAAVRAGDQRASARFVRTHGKRMLATAQRLLGDRASAEDAVQEAFVNAFRNLGQFEERSSIATWLHRIVVNVCLAKLRTRRRRAEEDIDDLMPTFDANGCRIEPTWSRPPPVDELVARREVRDLVVAKINELPEIYRIVLLLRDIEELDTREVAQVLGISEGATKVRLHRARAALKMLLEPVLGSGRP